MGILGTILDPVLGWTLMLPMWLSILILSLFVSVVISFIYKYTTNQALMKEWRAELKKARQKMRKLKDDPQKMLQAQSNMMKTQNKLMMHSMRPTLFTAIPMLVLFAWMSAHFAGGIIDPGHTFEVTATSSEQIILHAANSIVVVPLPSIEDTSRWNVTATAVGEYSLSFSTNTTNGTVVEQVERELRIGERPIEKELQTHSGVITKSTIDYPKLIVLPITLFGWQPGWLATYILFSMIFTLSIRRLMGIH